MDNKYNQLLPEYDYYKVETGTEILYESKEVTALDCSGCYTDMASSFHYWIPADRDTKLNVGIYYYFIYILGCRHFNFLAKNIWSKKKIKISK